MTTNKLDVLMLLARFRSLPVFLCLVPSVFFIRRKTGRDSVTWFAGETDQSGSPWASARPATIGSLKVNQNGDKGSAKVTNLW